MTETNRAWSLLAFGDERQYSGNSGYADDIRDSYQYDNSVPNHKRVRSGDLVLVRDKTRLVGTGIVQSVSSTDGFKDRLRCPVCGLTALKKRKDVKPVFRCNEGHEFDSPATEKVAVKVFVAAYGSGFADAKGELPASEIKGAALRPSDQLSIEELDIGRLENRLVETCPGVQGLLARFLQSQLPDALPASEAEEKSSFELSLHDRRESVLKSIVLRRGQAAFREGLIRRYGRACMVTGCNVVEIVEAAHIWPYRGTGDNHLDNGLLLRSDLHTLFDLNLVAVHPQTLQLRFHQRALADAYAAFEGVVLRNTHRHKPAVAPLEHRWDVFLTQLGR